MGKGKEKESEEKPKNYSPETYLREEGATMNIGETWGEIKISNEVVVTISSIAASNVEGVHCAGGKTIFGKKDIERGITAAVEENHAVITVEVKIDYGMNIYDTVRKLQKQIKDAVEQMTGLEVDKVNVTVKGVIMTDTGTPGQTETE